MESGTKAKITIGLLACFALAWGLFQQAYNASDVQLALAVVIGQLIAIFILSFVIMTILEWVNIFELKTNAILTLIVLIGFMLNLTIFLLCNSG